MSENPRQGDDENRIEIEDVDDLDSIFDEADPPRDDAGQGAAGETPEAQADGVSAELEELRDRLLRVTADYQNYKRRSQQETVTAREQQLISVARELATVMDHFDRALEVDSETTAAEDVLKGVMMVRDELMRALQRLGIQRIDVRVGDEFDPNLHEAMFRQPCEGVESNHITAQLHPGYKVNNKTVRPAGVSVAE